MVCHSLRARSFWHCLWTCNNVWIQIVPHIACHDSMRISKKGHARVGKFYCTIHCVIIGVKCQIIDYKCIG